MVRKRFFKPTQIRSWAVVVYEESRRFSQNDANQFAQGLAQAMTKLGKSIGFLVYMTISNCLNIQA